jgi:hypothetical protein
MFLSVVLLARAHEDAFIVRSTTSRVRLLVSGIKNMKAPFGMDEEEKHS